MRARNTTAPRPATIPTSSDSAHNTAGPTVRAGAVRSPVKTISPSDFPLLRSQPRSLAAPIAIGPRRESGTIWQGVSSRSTTQNGQITIEPTIHEEPGRGRMLSIIPIVNRSMRAIDGSGSPASHQALSCECIPSATGAAPSSLCLTEAH